MLEILAEKKQEVIQYLIEALSRKNKDLERTLNAQMVLTELADNETTFGNLVEKRNLISLIYNTCDFDNI